MPVTVNKKEKHKHIFLEDLRVFFTMFYCKHVITK